MVALRLEVKAPGLQALGHAPGEAALDAIVRLVESDFAADEKIGQETAG